MEGRRNHLIMLYLCARCLWNSAVVCKPNELPPRSIPCSSCVADGVPADAGPVEGLLASDDECQRFALLCNSLDVQRHKEAFGLLAALRGRYRVVVTEWARDKPGLPALDVGAFKEQVREEEQG